ncbi:MAG: nucleotide exchange factor GrpE [Elusimicrobia bacterium]|nr:nucleotide exchange factor GrpE [Elusimicrobiota bacterium]
MNQEKNNEEKSPDQLTLEQKLNELALLKESLDEQKQKAAEYYDQLLRLKAEFENYRRRVEKEKLYLVKFGQEGVLLKMLPFIDNVERALQAAREHDNHKTILEGLVMIEKEFRNFLKQEGVEPIKTHQEKLDPSLHHVVSQEESADQEDDDILEEIQKGYSYKGTVIRPALVKVAKRKQ